MNNSGNCKLVWQEASKMALMLSPPFKGGLDLVICFKWLEYGRSEGMRFPRLGYQKTVASVLDTCTSSLTLREASCPVVSCPLERPTWQGPKGGLWPVAHEKLRLSLQPVRKWVLPATVSVNLEVSLDKPSNVTVTLPGCLHLHERSWAIGTHRNYEIINVCGFKSLSFGVSCYMAMGS